jgi:hypothetical protein
LPPGPMCGSPSSAGTPGREALTPGTCHRAPPPCDQHRAPGPTRALSGAPSCMVGTAGSNA